MADTQTQLETTPFWRFSLHFYRQPGVADACVTMQDGCSVDVNVLLFLLWLASDQRQLSYDDVQGIDNRARGWRNLTVIPIRDTRRKLKGAQTLIETGKQEAFRNKVKAVELEAERLQQEALYALVKAGPLGSHASPEGAARANVGAYERVMNAKFPVGALDTLFDAFDSIAHRQPAATQG